MAKKSRPRKTSTKRTTDEDTTDTTETEDDESEQPIGDGMTRTRRQLIVAHATRRSEEPTTRKKIGRRARHKKKK
jgi:hypothetical protein